MPRCQRCGHKLSWSTGLPVSVSFNDEGTVATISVDTGELTDDANGLICGCHPTAPEVTDLDERWMQRALDHVSKNYAPEMDCDLPDYLDCAMADCEMFGEYRFTDQLNKTYYCGPHVRKVVAGAIDRGEPFSVEPL